MINRLWRFMYYRAKGRIWCRVSRWMKCRPAVVRHRDGSSQLVDVLCDSLSGEGSPDHCYVFAFPGVAWDTGFEVPRRYLQYWTRWGAVYVFIALKVARRFPKWVTI